ncbi:hypothetical protein [Massilia sp. GCM10023247]|uniref:hypothetical protein n=1 Tax=Massilia sp. GCM10023247 TaxID=3252643 RepID=UPI00360F280F
MKAHPLGRALAGAAFILAASLVLRWAAPAWLGEEMARRLLGVLLGLVVVVYANAIPKSLVALARLRCSPAREQAARRFAGWSLVLGGLGYMAAALLAPLASMHLVGGAILAVALAAAILRCTRAGATISG